VVLIASWS